MTENQEDFNKILTGIEVFNKILTGISEKNLGIETLETRKMDDLDFHEVSVWSLKEALRDAFLAGMQTGMTL